MIFAIETEELTLYVFSDEAAAVSYCKGIDVEAAIWAFWDDAGIPLSANFTTFPKRGIFSASNGQYHLVQDSNFFQIPLLEILEDIKNVNSQTSLNSPVAIKQYIQAQAKDISA
jgi:hypothetical protein